MHTGLFEFKSGKNSKLKYGENGLNSVLKNHFLEKNYRLRTPVAPKTLSKIKFEGYFYYLDPKWVRP